MISDNNGADHFGASANINMTSDRRHPALSSTYGYLLENKAIDPDPRTRVNDHPVWVRQQEAPADR